MAVWRASRLWLLAAALLVSLAALAFELARRSEAGEIARRAGASALIRAQVVESVLTTQRAVAATLAEDAAVRAVLLAADPGALVEVSRKLERLRAETGSTVIYLLDTSGNAIAASNWDEEVSFVGQNYGFRAYFSEALQQGTALEFAMGTVSHRPGLYLSHDVPAGPQGAPALGVVVVKMEFGPIEAAWAAAGEAIFVTDPAGRVVIASDPARRFAALPAGEGRITVTRPLAGAEGWALTLQASGRPASLAGALAAAAVLGAGLLAGLAGFGLWRARHRAALRAAEAERYRADLEAAVAARTEALTAEMGERRAAEARLAGMQADLVQANKLATLGQVSAGLAHEINQPVATIRLLAENGLSLFESAPEETRQALASIVRMSGRIGEITGRLRGFTRKATGAVEPVPLAEAIEASLLLTASRRRADGARLTILGLEPGMRVQAERVRLEQILVNLIQNAQEAVAGRPDPEIRITVSPEGRDLWVAVADNGPGLAPEIARQLFTPFATSKPGGLGLGLVIAKDIARDLGGDLLADPPAEALADMPGALPGDLPGGGAVFRLRLVRA